MPADVNAVGVSAVTGDVLVDPAQSGAAVVHLLRVLGPRSQAVTHRHQHCRRRGDGGGHETQQVLVADDPVTPVHEHQHGGEGDGCVVGHVDVQHLPLVVAVGKVQGHAGGGPHLIGPSHCLLKVLWCPRRGRGNSFSLFDHRGAPPAWCVDSLFRAFYRLPRKWARLNCPQDNGRIQQFMRVQSAASLFPRFNQLTIGKAEFAKGSEKHRTTQE